MSSIYGENLKLSIFGQSHGPAIGMTLDGIPAGLPIDLSALQNFLERRAPGRNDLSTPRREPDCPEFLSGIVDNFTCGAPIAAVIHNRNTRSADYENLKSCPRPGHADYTAQVKYGGFQDPAGGGHFSGRLTAPLCIAGGLCLQWLQQQGIAIRGHISHIGTISDSPRYLDPCHPEIENLDLNFPVISHEAANAMAEVIRSAHSQGDSVGGEIECIVTGLPAGIGEPMFSGVESKIAQIIYAIPAVKSLEFGIGTKAQELPGSQVNDCFKLEDNRIVTATNHSGGILGGITNGMPLVFRLTVKPTPSISQPQNTLNMVTGEQTGLQIQGRHDPCIVPRAVSVVEAATAIALYDLILGNTQTGRRK